MNGTTLNITCPLSGTNYRWLKLSDTFDSGSGGSFVDGGSGMMCSDIGSDIGSGSGMDSGSGFAMSSGSGMGSGSGSNGSGFAMGSGGGDGNDTQEEEPNLVTEQRVLEFDPIVFGDEGVYQCVATLDGGEEDTITVASKLHILKIPCNVL